MRFTVRSLVALLATLLSAATYGQGVTPASAAASAATAVPTPAQIRSSVSLGTQQANFGTYSPGPNEAQFSGGKGNASPLGAARKAGCAGNTTDPECFAIQALQNGRANPTTWVPLNGPQLTGRHAVVADPTAVLGVDPATVAGASAAVQCRTENISTPEVREENHCYVSTPNTTVSCSLGVEVVVDPDYVYKCLIRVGTNSSTSCSVGQVVTVDATTTYQCVERLRSNQANACLATRVVEVQADTNYQCIDQARTIANAACTVGQILTIDPRFNYTCTDTPNAVTSNDCARKLSVSCVQGSCGGLSITPVGLDPAVFFAVYPDWPTSNLSSVLMEFDGVGVVDSQGYYYFEFDLVITGTMLPGTFQSFLKIDWGSYLSINGVFYSSPSPASALTTGTNRLGIYYRAVQTTGETPRLSLLLYGSYCQPPVCTDTWDESPCAPYKNRL